jgi:hypothetical protein
MTRDEKRYPDACRFVPERFIDANGALTNDDPKQYVFGLGRRICPGGLCHSDVVQHVMSQDFFDQAGVLLMPLCGLPL